MPHSKKYILLVAEAKMMVKCLNSDSVPSILDKYSVITAHLYCAALYLGTPLYCIALYVALNSCTPLHCVALDSSTAKPCFYSIRPRCDYWVLKTRLKSLNWVYRNQREPIHVWAIPQGNQLLPIENCVFIDSFIHYLIHFYLILVAFIPWDITTVWSVCGFFFFI